MSIAEEWDDDSQPELDDFDGEADYDEHASGGGSRAYAEDYPSPVSTIPEASDEGETDEDLSPHPSLGHRSPRRQDDEDDDEMGDEVRRFWLK